MSSCYRICTTRPGHTAVTRRLPVLLLLLLLSFPCCVPKATLSKQVALEGIYIKNLGHPFSGAAIMAQGGYYRISEDSAGHLQNLQDGTRVKITGTVVPVKRTIPEAGTFTEITEKIITIDSCEVIEQHQGIK